MDAKLANVKSAGRILYETKCTYVTFVLTHCELFIEGECPF